MVERNGVFLDWFTNIYTIVDVMGNVFGTMRGGNSPKDGTNVSQGRLGVLFGKGDERTMQIILHNDNITEHERSVLTDFFRWHFDLRQADSAWDKFLVWWYMGSFRVFLTGIKSPVGKEVITTEVDTPDGDKVKKKVSDTITVEDENKDPHRDAVRFLKYIVKLIEDGDAESRTKNTRLKTDRSHRIRGYRKVLEYFEAYGVPMVPPDDIVGWVEDMFKIPRGWAKKAVKLVNTGFTGLLHGLHVHARAIRIRRRHESTWARTMRKIFSFGLA